MQPYVHTSDTSGVWFENTRQTLGAAKKGDSKELRRVANASAWGVDPAGPPLGRNRAAAPDIPDRPIPVCTFEWLLGDIRAVEDSGEVCHDPTLSRGTDGRSRLQGHQSLRGLPGQTASGDVDSRPRMSEPRTIRSATWPQGSPGLSASPRGLVGGEAVHRPKVVKPWRNEAALAC